MPKLVVNGAPCSCSFGASPATLLVLPAKKVMGAKLPIATILDNIPLTNILPFGMCSSIANPTVASATAAALGVLTPMPCVPVVPAPWAPGKPMVMVGKTPALDETSKCACAWGGVIQLSNGGQGTVDAK